jgi:hypothetical protein
MGIRTKNLHHTVLALNAAGTLTAAASKACQMVPFSGFITNVAAVIGTPGSGVTNTILDVNYNGTTIFGAAAKVTFAATTGVASYSTLSSTPFSVTAGSIMTLDADAVPTSGANASVFVTISRTPQYDASNLVDHDNVL